MAAAINRNDFITIRQNPADCLSIAGGLLSFNPFPSAININICGGVGIIISAAIAIGAHDADSGFIIPTCKTAWRQVDGMSPHVCTKTLVFVSISDDYCSIVIFNNYL